MADKKKPTIRDAIKATARAAALAVVTVTNNVYHGVTDCEANKKRFADAVEFVLKQEEVIKIAKSVTLGWLVSLSPILRLVVGFAVEAAYQAMKAAGTVKPPVVVKAVGVQDDWDYKLVKHVHNTGGAEIVFGQPRTGTPINPPAPESVVDIHEQAEPGNGE